jgi:hypothetical protein
MASEAIDLLRNAYYAFGFGLPVAALDLFDQLPGRRRAKWLAHDLYHRRRDDRELPAADGLFANIPASWEVTRVAPESMKQDGDVVIVTGHVFCRPKGAWTTTSLPFAHVWTLCRGKAIRVFNCLDGIELRRQDPPAGCALSSARTPWRARLRLGAR